MQRTKLVGLLWAFVLTALSSGVPALAGNYIFPGFVELGRCNGATATYTTLTGGEQKYGFGGRNQAAVLVNAGSGRAGVVFTFDYSAAPYTYFHELRVRFKDAGVARNFAKIRTCGLGGTQTFDFNKLGKITNVGGGWSQLRFDALDLHGRGPLNAVSIWLPDTNANMTIGETLLSDYNGSSNPDNLDLNLHGCGILHPCN